MTVIGAPLDQAITLDDHLRRWAAGNAHKGSLVELLTALAGAACAISALIGGGSLSSLSGRSMSSNSDGDTQKPLDIETNRLILAALRLAPVAFFASEEEETILTLRSDGAFAVAVDPLDGSSNIDVNISVGTIFSVYPRADQAAESFLRPASEQCAAGYFIYGPHTALILTVGAGVDLFVLNPANRQFELVARSLAIPADSAEYAINASNAPHWGTPIRNYIDDSLKGSQGPHGRNYTMRWVGSLVAEAHRIFTRGGLFLYPSDGRQGHANGRLRQVYEAAPMALLVEQAGGLAIDGINRILDQRTAYLHQRTPLIFGSARNVALVQRYHTDPGFARNVSPLFRRRGLFIS